MSVQYLVSLEVRVDRVLKPQEREILVAAIKRACDAAQLPYDADVVTDTSVEHLGSAS